MGMSHFYLPLFTRKVSAELYAPFPRRERACRERWRRSSGGRVSQRMDLRQRVAVMGQPTYDSLPRRLQACMQELLSANERYHELLIATRGQEAQLQQAQAEIERLTQLLATAEEAVELRLDESARERVAASDLREAYALQQGRLEALECEVLRLQGELAALGHRGAAQSAEVAQLQKRCEEAEQRAEQAEQRGFAEGLAQQRAEDQARLRQMQARAKEGAARAFDEGRQQASSSQQAALLREQAQRRLLLHRAEEKRAQQQACRCSCTCTLTPGPNPSPSPHPKPNPSRSPSPPAPREEANPNPNPNPNPNRHQHLERKLTLTLTATSTWRGR